MHVLHNINWRIIILSCNDLQHMGTREDVASKIDAETKIRLQEMLRALAAEKQKVIDEVLNLVYDIKPEIHKNYREHVQTSQST